MSKKKSELGRQNVEKGKAFEDDVAELYRLMGYDVTKGISICNKKVDLLASIQIPGSKQLHRIIIECKDEKKIKLKTSVF